jgi:hypothetical protein
MPGHSRSKNGVALLPGIHVLRHPPCLKFVDGRDKPGHDGDLVAMICRGAPSAIHSSARALCLFLQILDAQAREADVALQVHHRPDGAAAVGTSADA